MKKRAFVRYSKNGKIVPGSLILTGGSYPQGSSTWKEVPADLCCGTSCDTSKLDVSQLLSNMNDCYEEVTNLIPNIVYFTDYGDGYNTYIDNGCNDMYDNANSFNTNLTQPYNVARGNNLNFNSSIPYTHTQDNGDADECDYTNPPMDGVVKSGAGFFNTPSCSCKYFTNMYPGLFMLAATGVDVTQFGIYGNLGTDGNGIGQGYSELTNNPNWTVFLKTNKDIDNEDPSVTHITLVYGNVDNVIHAVDANGDWDDDVLVGLSSENTAIISVVLATEAGENLLTIDDAVAIGDKILDIYTNGC